jgi:2-iminobutanoate/2-iminopropanoate deaminase
MAKQKIQSDAAPKALGPYSQAIVGNGFVFCSGQIGLAPPSGEMVPGGVQAQTHQVLKNLQGVLQAAGSDLSKVVKTTVFLKNMSDFTAMNEIYAGYFGDVPPARSTVEVARLPRDALVEIELVALL